MCTLFIHTSGTVGKFVKERYRKFDRPSNVHPQQAEYKRADVFLSRQFELADRLRNEL